LGGVADDDVEHALNICRRAADNSQDFAGRGLLLRGLAKFLRLRGDRLL
jgi:hypothetical protein